WRHGYHFGGRHRQRAGIHGDRVVAESLVGVAQGGDDRVGARGAGGRGAGAVGGRDVVVVLDADDATREGPVGGAVGPGGIVYRHGQWCLVHRQRAGVVGDGVVAQARPHGGAGRDGVVGAGRRGGGRSRVAGAGQRDAGHRVAVDQLAGAGSELAAAVRREGIAVGLVLVAGRDGQGALGDA